MLKAKETFPHLWKVYDSYAFNIMLLLHHNLRALRDCHLEAIANYSCELEQLDILGTNNVTLQGVEK